MARTALASLFSAAIAIKGARRFHESRITSPNIIPLRRGIRFSTRFITFFFALPCPHRTSPLPLPSQVPKSKTFFRGRNERVAESRCGRLAPRGEFTFLARRNRHDPSARFNARVISSSSRRLLCTIARLFAWQLVLERRGTTWEVIVSR